MGNSESSSSGNSSSSSFLVPPEEGEGYQISRREKKPVEEGGSSNALKVGAAVAGTALVALGAWRLLSDSTDHDTATDEKKKMVRAHGVDGGSGSCGGGGGDFRPPYSKPHLTLPLRNTNPCSDSRTLKILSYNVWFREDMEVHKRIEAIGMLIEHHSPDLICFQEVTPNIYEIFQNFNWSKAYHCSVSPEMATKRRYFCMLLSKLPVKEFSRKPFHNSVMGRELCTADVDVGLGKKLVFATSHLESPSPAVQMYSTERTAQAKEALGLLQDLPNVIFGGDMNWDDKLDGPFPLPLGWLDAWEKLKPQENGWTYDTKANPMLSANFPLQKRLDRFICKLRDFKISNIDMIGTEAIPGISYFKEKKVGRQSRRIELPVLPSDHYGLLLTICSL